MNSDSQGGDLPRSRLNTPINDDEISKEEPLVWDGQMNNDELLKAETGRPSSMANDGPPNGGLQAWLQVLGSFFLNMNSWGIVNSFGVYQTFYETGFLGPVSSSDISWIGSIQGFLLMFSGVVTGPLYDAGYFQTLIRIGSFLTVLGIMMTSLSTQYWQAMLAQAVCIGLASGCVFVPSFAIIPQYFTTRNAFATGVAASGSSVGGIIYPVVFRQLQPHIGFAWATRVIGFIALAGFVVSLSVMRLRVVPSQRRALIEPKAFKELPYLLFTISLFLSFAGLYTPIFYLPSFSIQSKITTENLGFYTVPILNAASIVGRVLPNFFADRTGAFNMLIPCSFATSILSFGWIGIDSIPSVIIFAILYGFFSGAFVSLPPSAIVSLSPSLGVVGTRMGMCFGITAFGLLIGTPVSGAILNGTGRYLGTQLFCGSILLLAMVLMVSARYAKFGAKLLVKA